MGHDQCAAIAADQELGLSGKVFIGSPNRVPNETVLKRRLDYLLSLLISSPSPSPSPAPSPSPSPQTSATLTRTLPVREALSRQWTEAAREAGAAPITFANNVDKEDLPPGLESFRYLENTFDQSVVVFPDLFEDLPRCQGHSVNVAPSSFRNTGHSCLQKNGAVCNCIVGLAQAFKESVYDCNGMYRFPDLPDGEYVVECHALCDCDAKCPNRRSQWPRDTALEIFKVPPFITDSPDLAEVGGVVEGGWGVRAINPVKRGHVIGFFTGPREEEDGSEFVFDIDTGEEPGTSGGFSVDATECGNWSRFINHSCAPNMRVITAAVEAPPDYRIGRLVFVAQEDIRPREELTIDYYPGRSPEFSPRCLCGSPSCRDGPLPLRTEPEDWARSGRKKRSRPDDDDASYAPTTEYND